VRFGVEQTAEAVKFYKNTGAVAINDLISKEELVELRDAYDTLVLQKIIPTSSEQLLVRNDIIYDHPVFEQFMRHPAIVNFARSIMGPNIELQHSKIINKFGPDTGNLKWHQDFQFFPHTNYNLHAFAIHLDDEDETSGPLIIIPGSNLWGEKSHEIDGEFFYGCTENIDYGKHEQVLLTGKAGMITVHHCLTFHCSKPKTNDRSRRILYFQYRASDAIQLAGAIWKCTGENITSDGASKVARFPNGDTIAMRGSGRLFDIFGKLRSDGRSSEFSIEVEKSK
jgi:phytanoyl-CoA hydroxylase